MMIKDQSEINVYAIHIRYEGMKRFNEVEKFKLVFTSNIG